MRITTVIIVLLGLWMNANTAFASVRDSVGMTVIDGQEYVVYRVDPGDNLNLISGKFRTTVADIRKANRLYDSKVKIGQVLYIPYERAPQPKKEQPTELWRGEGMMRGDSPKEENVTLRETEETVKETETEEINPLEKDRIEVSLRDVLEVEVEAREETPGEVTMEIIFDPEDFDATEERTRALSQEVADAPVETEAFHPEESPNETVEEVVATPGVFENEGLTRGGGQEKIHVVTAGQTLYAISRLYGVSVAKIKEWNRLENDALDIGQKLIVSPVTGKVSDPAPVKSAKTDARTHKVEAGETLYSVSRLYSVSVAELKAVNGLEENALNLGQELTIPGEEAPRQPGKPLMEAIEEVEPQPQEVAVIEDKFTPVEVLSASPDSKLPTHAKTTEFTARNGKKFFKVEERGSAAAIDDFSTDQTRFFCFHQTLPKGTYLRVDNPAKGQSVLVEVVGQLPANTEEIIHLTAKAREYLRLKKGGEVVLRYLKPR